MPPPDSFGPVGIIDIGSNSIRFVAYGGNPRVPSVLFNEKVMAGLGEELDSTGLLSSASMERALAALARFRLLARHLGLTQVHTVATAAVRDAANGTAFLRKIASLGFEPLLLDGAEEADLAGYGVLSAIPQADGIAADLGGGSLELARVARGAVGKRHSLPLGVLRVGADPPGVGALAERIADALASSGIEAAGAGKPLYLVGGSWRALALIDLHFTGHPLPIVHQHEMARDRIRPLRDALATADRESLRAIRALSGSRIPTLPVAGAILEAVSRVVGPSSLIACAYGLREGLLYRALAPDKRANDPLHAAAREVGRRHGRFDDHGDLLDGWIAPIFADDGATMRRLRLAACLLADIAWGAHPDFRAERAVDMALHGNWVAIDAAGRAILALTLFTLFGGTHGFDDRLADLCGEEERRRAREWGLAIRLGQRLSAGVAAPIAASALRKRGNVLTLALSKRSAALGGEAVLRRHRQLAAAMELEPRLDFS